MLKQPRIVATALFIFLEERSSYKVVNQFWLKTILDVGKTDERFSCNSLEEIVLTEQNNFKTTAIKN